MGDQYWRHTYYKHLVKSSVKINELENHLNHGLHFTVYSHSEENVRATTHKFPKGHYKV